MTCLEAEQLTEIIGIDPEVADDMIIYAEEESERIEREGEPEEEVPAEAPAIEGEVGEVVEGAVSEEAAAIAEGEVAAESTADVPAVAPAGGFESLFRTEPAPVAAATEEPAAETEAPAEEQPSQERADESK